jgi:hypothetical protein
MAGVQRTHTVTKFPRHEVKPHRSALLRYQGRCKQLDPFPLEAGACEGLRYRRRAEVSQRRNIERIESGNVVQCSSPP